MWERAARLQAPQIETSAGEGRRAVLWLDQRLREATITAAPRITQRRWEHLATVIRMNPPFLGRAEPTRVRGESAREQKTARNSENC